MSDDWVSIDDALPMNGDIVDVKTTSIWGELIIYDVLYDRDKFFARLRYTVIFWKYKQK